MVKWQYPTWHHKQWSVTCIPNLGAFAMNAYIIVCHVTQQAILVDPGDDAATLSGAMQQLGAQLKLIFLTHGHLDHVLAVSPLYRDAVDLWLPRLDEPLYLELEQQCRLYGMPPVAPESRYHLYDDATVVEVGSLRAVTRLNPGHTPGSSSLYFASAEWLVSGDLVFAGSIGRTDLWGGNMQQMQQSLHALHSLPDNTVIFPGHGPSTRLAEENAHNPYLRL